MQNVEYAFIKKPKFPVLGEKHADSIDWTTQLVDPFAYSSRHTGSAKSQVVSNKRRIPNNEQKITLQPRPNMNVLMGSIAS